MSTTKYFQWVDRDTAARNLLELYQVDLDFLRDRVLSLLYAIHSPAVISELLGRVSDHNMDITERDQLIDIIAATSGNVYLPDIEYLTQSYGLYRSQRTNLLRYANLLKNHPINKAQVIPLILEQLASIDDIKKLHQEYKEWIEYLPELIAPLLMALIDDNPKLFDLRTASRLHIYAPQLASQWLQDRWDEIIYLCLIDGYRDKKLTSPNHYRFVEILENWPQLKTDLFRRCSAIVEEYAQKKSSYDHRFQPKFDIRSSYSWQELEMSFGLVLQGEEERVKKFLWMHLYSNSDEDIRTKAGATYLVGTVLDRYPSLIRYFASLVEDNRHCWQDDDEDIYQLFYPIRYEAANALRKIVTASTWETFIRAYLKQPFNELVTWIAELTDQLSGMPIEYSNTPIEYRPWFRSLYEADKCKL